MFTWVYFGIAVLLYILCVGITAVLARYINTKADYDYDSILNGGRLVIALVVAPIFLVAIAILLIADAIWSGLRFVYLFAAGQR